MVFLIIVFWIVALPIIIILAAVIPAKRHNNREETRRQNISLIWDNSMTREEFERIAIVIASPIKRLRVSVKDQFVSCTVRTVSGLDTWTFTLDFNDYGKITGRYWITQLSNYDSQIPSRYGDMLKNAVNEHLNKGSNHFSSDTVEHNYVQANTQIVRYCKNCGTQIVPPGRYCKNCGTRLF